MKTSSVTINVVITVGCMMLFMTGLPLLLIYGAKHYNLSEKDSSALCYVRSIFVHIYFTCSYIHNFIGTSLSGPYWIQFVLYCIVT